MADVRALLAAERQARRISHPLLTYTKSGQLLCNTCNLNVKSEALWEGHLRSANHRKNVAKVSEEKSTKSLKRKLDDFDQSDDDAAFLPEDDARKKPKSRVVSHAEDSNAINGMLPEAQDIPPLVKTVRFDLQEPPPEEPAGRVREPLAGDGTVLTKEQAEAAENDDEMAAFEREIASLEHRPDYSAATISAAPVSTSQLEAQQTDDRKNQQETEAEDEIDEERRKIEEEFEAMEELEVRINKLKERREALRSSENRRSAAAGGSKDQIPSSAVSREQPQQSQLQQESESEDGDDEADDWYG